MVKFTSFFLSILALNVVVIVKCHSIAQQPLSITNKNEEAIIYTKTQGTFKGNRLDSNTVDEFLNIPFAKPPIGHLRFAKTQAIEPFRGTEIRMATKPGPICIQPPSSETLPNQIQSEDCLQLNIYKPSNLPKNKKLPVMVWLYGGSWQTGSINQERINATNFIKRSIELEEPVVWVAANYRLGAFGFLGGRSIVEAEQKGEAVLNAGIWDQRQALHWIQDNIDSFGGDPSRVILYGESAGAANVGHHLMADKGKGSKGLIHGAIQESGNAGTGRRLPPTHSEVENVYQFILQGSGCSNETSSLDQVHCLKQRSTKEIIMANNLVLANSYVPYQPTLDNYFIQQYPSVQWAKQEYLHVPFITGDNLDEGTEFPYPLTVTDDEQFKQAQMFAIGQQIEPIFDSILDTWSSEPQFGSPYRPEFFDLDQQDSYYPPLHQNQYKRQASMFQDVFFETGRRLQLHSAVRHNVPAWSYRFAQPSPFEPGVNGGIAKPSMGVQHEAEIPFVFANPPLQSNRKDQHSQSIPNSLLNFASDENLLQVSNVMSAAWIHFANNFNPNGKDVPAWNQFQSDFDSKGNGMEFYIQANNFSMNFDNSQQSQIQFVIDHSQYFFI